MTINEGRRCALPGCYVVIEPEPDGRPQRKYCTAAHRAVARQMRREGTHRSATAPPLPLPTPAPPQPTRVPLPAASTRRRDIAIAALRRCRAAAVLGSAGLLVTGGGLMAASSPAGIPSTISAIPWNAADPDAQQKWASKAQVTLASLDTQIGQIDQAKQSWTSLPPARQYAPLPTPIRNLDQQRKLLVAQRQALQSEVDTYHNAQQTSQNLADTEDGLSALDNTLEQSSSQPLTPQQAQTYQLLNQQRQEKVEQRDSQRTQLTSLRNNIRKAVSAPLPDDDNSTKSITSEVANLVAHPELDKQSRRPDHSNARPTSPEVTAPREPDDPETDDVGNGAPPNPGKARPEIPQGPQVLADGAKPLQNGAVSQLDGVTQALPKVGLPQIPAVQAPAAPHVEAPGQNNPSILAAPGQPGGLGSTLGNAGNTLGNTANSLTQPLNVTPAPSANATQPAPGTPNVYQAPSGSGGLGSALNSPTLPLNLASGPPAPSGDSGWGSHRATPASAAGGDGGFDHIVRDPISRIADSEPDSSASGNSHSTDHGSWDIPDKSSPAPTVPLPSTPAYPSSDSGSHSSSSDDEKARMAEEIAGSMLGGGMGDLVSSAVKAKEAQNAGGGSSTNDSDSGGWGDSSSDGDSSDLRDSILQDYGISSDKDSNSSDSNSSDSSLSDSGWSNNDSSSSDRGSSDYSSADVDNIIDHYAGSGSDDKDSGSDDNDWSSMVSSVSQSHDDSDSDSSDSHDGSSSDYSSYSSGSSSDDSDSDSSYSSDDSDSHDSYSDSDSSDDSYSDSSDSDSGDDDSYSDSDSSDSDDD